jgi:hypothetical protein
LALLVTVAGHWTKDQLIGIVPIAKGAKSWKAVWLKSIPWAAQVGQLSTIRTTTLLAP